MAYLVYITAVDDKDYQEFFLKMKRTSTLKKFLGETPPLKAYKTFFSTSFLTGAKQYYQDFNDSLRELLFGGTIVNDFFWHPLSPAKYHAPPEVKRLYTDIVSNYNLLLKIPDTTGYNEFFEFEMNKILTELNEHVEKGHALIIMYEKPADNERAKKTRHINLISANR